MSLFLAFLLFLAILTIISLITIIFASRHKKLNIKNSPILGAIAKVETDLTPTGLILIDGEAWQAFSSVKVAKGQKVKVIAIEGVLLKVEPILPEVFS
jgi:membrane-bound serine protease (ClpP class)